MPKGRKLGTLLTLLLLASCVIPAQVTQPPAPAPPVPVGSAGGPVTTIPTQVVTTLLEPPTGGADVMAEVESVTDGDTIRVRMPDGTNEPVRLIGIDAPGDGSLLDQQATDYLEELVLGEDVRMVVDVSDRDRFDRLLRYVYVGNLFVNEEMVRVGLAIAKRYKPDIAMALVLEAAQKRAEQGALGLFSVIATTAPPTTTTQPSTTTRPSTTSQPPTTTTTIAATTTATVPASCHSSYPDFCIPPPPPDLNCGDIGYKNFTVLPPDPHGFDGNNDGVGCES